MARGIVTLTTDFGYSDHYVGVLKGVILNINPDAQLIDVCHDLRPYDVMDGAFAIAQAYHYFPSGTIHLVVVDPGVGGSRRPILVSAGQYHFVAPDNGVLSLLYAREETVTVRHITASRYFLQPVSRTFHARDIFGPVAAWVSRQVEPEQFGAAVDDFVSFPIPRPLKVNDSLLKGTVLRADRFGTLTTNLTPDDVPELFGKTPPAFRLVVGKKEVTRLAASYEQESTGEVFAILGSSGYLEISVNQGDAAAAVGVGGGAEVALILG